MSGVRKANYTSGKKNKQYALDAYKLIRQCRVKVDMSSDEKVNILRAVVIGNKAYNQQMHVVVALWDAGLLNI